MISKDKFISAADSLYDSYAEFGRCLYSEAAAEGLTDSIYKFMITHNGSSTEEVLTYLDNALGNPRPVVKIVGEKEQQGTLAFS